jgi:hypothetical protein
MQISTIGIDLAKTVFQVHGVDAFDKPILKKQRNSLDAAKCLSFSASCCRASSAWRRAQRRTTGLASSESLATMCD